MLNITYNCLLFLNTLYPKWASQHVVFSKYTNEASIWQEPTESSFKHAVTQQTFTTRLVMSLLPSV